MRSQAYQLPIYLLLDTMRMLQETVTLRASLSVAHGGNVVDALTDIVIERGNVISCSIRALQTGALLAHDAGALHLLTHTGVLEWQVVPRASLSPGELSLSSLFAETLPVSRGSNEAEASGQPDERMSVPKQATTLHDTRIALLPPKGRQVFLLSNGARSCEEIARLLGLSGEGMRQVMRVLAEQRLIVWQSPTR